MLSLECIAVRSFIQILKGIFDERMENAGETSAQRLLARALERNTLRLLGHLTFEFKKRRQLFIRTHNETLSVAAMCVSNPDRSPVGIHG